METRMDDGAPGLEVGFAIDTGGSFDELLRLQSAMDSTEGRILAEAKRIEAATGCMMQMGPATARIVGFGNAATRELQNINRERANTEKIGEGLIRQLDRETAALGRTREEMRAAKVEATALAAAKVGNTDLADRLFASSRQRQLAADAIAEDRAAAAEKAAAQAALDHAASVAAVNAQLLERSRLEAAIERNTGVGRPSAVQGGATFSALAERERGLEIAEREASATRQQNNLLAEQASIRAALERTTGVGRTRATDNGATFSALAAREADNEARATAAAAVSAERLAREHAELVAMVRGSEAAMVADAAAAERLRMATDPLYAATKRLNDEIAESTRLYHAGATAPAEYARQQEVLAGRMRSLGQAHDVASVAGKRNAGTLTQLSFQLNDVATMAAMGAKPMQIFASQAGQIFQVAQMAEGGVKGFATQMGGLLLTFTPLIAVAAVAGVAIYRWKEQINDDAGLKKFADGLGLTHKEMKKLGDVSITTGDLVAGVWKTISDGAGLGGGGKKLLDYLFAPDDAKQVQTFVSQIYGVFVGGYNGIMDLWGTIAPAISGFVSRAAAAATAFFKPLIEAAQWAGNGISQVFSAIYSWVAERVRAMAQWIAPVLSAVGFDKAAAAMSAAGSSIGATFGKAYAASAQQFISASNKAVATAAANAVAHAQDRLTKKATEIKADRTPKAPKVDHHAEQLEREAAAVEAQIVGLYKLADAYRVSGAQALIAEARAKAETDAIKKRGDIEEFVARQVRLAIAQRVSDAAKGAATMRDQAAAQEQVNTMVAAGLEPSERAADLVRERMADLPLLAAIEAAQKVHDLIGIREATRALEDQRAARVRLTNAEADARYNAAMAAGGNRLAELREELRLIGATDVARARSLAELQARQDAVTMPNLDPAELAAYVKLQGDLAVQGVLNAQAQDAYNASLTATADRWDIIAGKVQSAGQGMADAFGNAGRAIGDMASIFANYSADRARAEAEHEAAIRRAGNNEALLARANTQFALRSSGAQIAAFGDMASAAKGFFKEGSSGYKALADAEKVFRAVQFALSVRAMAQDVIETGTRLANSAARTAAGAVEAVVNAIKSLPFPLNIAAGAATIGALASIGVAIAGSFGGSAKPAASNTGTGTVLGDTTAKSESLSRSIEALRQVDDATLGVSRDMLASLRSIENNIGGLASLLVRTGNINASAGVTEGFKPNAIGSILSNVPVIGGILGGLFGSKTTVTASGLFGGPQSIADVLNAGFDASYFSDVKKTKKLFGISAGSSTSTKLTGADAGIEDQFGLLLRQFYTTIGQAAVPLGASLDAVQSRLLGFTVDIGKIDLQGLSGTEIQEKLSAVFGAAADSMAEAATPGIARFQKVGEGAFETLIRVSSTVEQVDAVFRRLGITTGTMGADVDMAIAGLFDSAADFTSAADAYFETYYSDAEQAAAKMAQMGRAFAGLGVAVPDTLAGFRALVEAQDLTTDAGRQMYATLLQLAPAFADLQSSMAGAKSAADILSERQDLQRKLLELNGDTAAIRALDLAKLDASNRGLQEQIYAVSDAQEAARAAEQLRDAWKSIGDTILDEVNRIRGLTDTAADGGFASIMGRFNAATSAARGGDQDAAKLLPGLSQALLKAAADTATSRQELARVQAQTAASLEATYGAIGALTGAASSSVASLSAAATATQATSSSTAANDDLRLELVQLREEVAGMRADNNGGHAATAGNAAGIKKTLDDAASGGAPLQVEIAA
jgi:hypothetical protein